MKGIYDNLTDEQKEKWNACEKEEEFRKFLNEEGIELPDELMDAAAGGWKPDWAPAPHIQQGEIP